MCLFIYKELAASSGEFAQTVSDLSAADVGNQSLADLSNSERKTQELQSVRSEQDMMTLMATGIYSFLFQLASI